MLNETEVTTLNKLPLLMQHVKKKKTWIIGGTYLIIFNFYRGLTQTKSFVLSNKKMTHQHGMSNIINLKFHIFIQLIIKTLRFFSALFAFAITKIKLK